MSLNPYHFEWSEGKVCEKCNGWGRWFGDEITICPNCKGTGHADLKNAVHKYLPMDKRIQELVKAGASNEEIGTHIFNAKPWWRKIFLKKKMFTSAIYKWEK